MATLFKDQSNIFINGDSQEIEVSDLDKPKKSHYFPGDIICGKVGKYPWWPCMVCLPPGDENNSTNGRVFVRYFGRENEVSWLNDTNIVDAQSRNELAAYVANAKSYRRDKKVSKRFNNDIDLAWKEIEEAGFMKSEERLQKFGVDYSVIQRKLKASTKTRSRTRVIVKKVEPIPKKRKPKHTEKESIKYAFSELDLPHSSAPSHKCCRYCLLKNNTTVACIKNCGSYFHKKCAAELKDQLPMEQRKEEEDDEEKCIECYLNCRLCHACRKDVANDDEVICSVSSCNKTYHRSCLESGSLSEMTRRTIDEKLICPQHLCHRCELVDQSPKFQRGKLFYCLMCSATYHNGDWCIPAGSVQLSKSEIICPKHLPAGGGVNYFLPPFVARIKSDTQSEIYGDSRTSDISELLTMFPKKDNTVAINVNWCFNCGIEGQLVCCETCPAAYHFDCAKLDSTPDHFYCIDCTSANYHNYGEIVWMKCGFYRWWPAQIMHNENVPENIMKKKHSYGQFVVQFFGTHEYLWVDKSRVFTFEEGDKNSLKKNSKRKEFEQNFSLALKEAEKGFRERELAWGNTSSGTALKSRKYKYIKINRPLGNVKRHKSLDIIEYPKCDCSYLYSTSDCKVDSDCINIQLKYECHQALCSMKERCQNQNFVKRNYPKQEVFCSSKCGWGLKTMEPIRKHQFVNEYVGEIIDIKEAERRKQWSTENNVTDFYFMELDNTRIIDARLFSNLARFMNHSCNPNLFAERWIVLDDQRIGLFALRDIEAGEELTFNYNLYTKSPNRLPCLCGAVNCSGFLGEQPKKLGGTKSKETSTERKKVTARRRVKKERTVDLEAADSISKGSMTNSISTVSLCTIKSVDKQCFRCYEYCNEFVDRSCAMEFCTKIYHYSCLDLSPDQETTPWFCPWHSCDSCGKFATHYCGLCTTSSCSSHFSADNFRQMSSTNDGICNNHS